MPSLHHLISSVLCTVPADGKVITLIPGRRGTYVSGNQEDYEDGAADLGHKSESTLHPATSTIKIVALKELPTITPIKLEDLLFHRSPDLVHPFICSTDLQATSHFRSALVDYS